MKLLIYGINYAPELTGIGKYTGEMAKHFAKQGHQVEVITAPPYYPQWKVKKGYANTWKKETIDDVTVLRCPLYVPRKINGVKRILHEVSFLLSSLWYWIPRYFLSYDAIICVSPPFHLGFMALPHKWFWGTTVINHIQDLQVDAARDLKIIESKWLLSVLERSEKWLLKRFTRVSTISKGMEAKLQEKFSDPLETIMFPNWVDSKMIYPVSKEDSMREEWGILPADKLVLYSGNLGKKQGLEVVLHIANNLRDRKGLHFIIVGEGVSKETLMELKESLDLTNVRFLPLQPLDRLSEMLASADVHLVLQKKAAADLVMPSKLTNILAVGGHALVTADAGTTLHDVVSENDLGTLVPAENQALLQDKIDAILTGDLDGNIAGATAFAADHLDKQAILSTFLTNISDVNNGQQQPDTPTIHQVTTAKVLSPSTEMDA
ncbi:WcaI family glycosyltransferase [Neolewinella antarctica]|uniref:Colanic acid biosynthesis glycosyl transferase WcaI n=1 Tax=Neolewinella antarctica TaxID=442734 RepID=A0ABX0XBJ4_9BACT|nr:WcaI family glycosyltransferase [Neolewinella antarctica]NJC26641.1 colanic acid biosynthesis glycosyl transferase WcaI [Neolewinella antarctica]